MRNKPYSNLFPFPASEFFTSSQFRCQPSEIDFQIPILQKQCNNIIQTGKFVTKEFNVDKIRINFPKTHSQMSVGVRDLKGNCMGKYFTMNGGIYDRSFERTDIKEGAWRSQRPLGRPAVLSQSQVLKDYFVSNTAQGNRNYILRQSSP